MVSDTVVGRSPGPTETPGAGSCPGRRRSHIGRRRPRRRVRRRWCTCTCWPGWMPVAGLTVIDRGSGSAWPGRRRAGPGDVGADTPATVVAAAAVSTTAQAAKGAAAPPPFVPSPLRSPLSAPRPHGRPEPMQCGAGVGPPSRAGRLPSSRAPDHRRRRGGFASRSSVERNAVRSESGCCRRSFTSSELRRNGPSLRSAPSERPPLGGLERAGEVGSVVKSALVGILLLLARLVGLCLQADSGTAASVGPPNTNRPDGQCNLPRYQTFAVDACILQLASPSI